jgi:anti-sigma B factor antagonist
MIQTVKHSNSTFVVRPGTPRLTAVNASTFKEEVIALINDGATNLIIDFDEVTFLDSSGLGALTGVLKRVGHRGDVLVCGLNNDVSQIFRICRMDRIFKIYRDVDRAIQVTAQANLVTSENQ